MYQQSLVNPPRSASLRFRRGDTSTLALLAIAVCAGMLLIGIGVTALVILSRGPANNAAVAEELERLKKEHEELDKEREKLNADKQKADFKELMRQADQSMAKKQFEEAEKTYDAALKLFPHDADALNGRIAALACAAAEGKSKEEKEKRQAQYAKCMGQGKKALGDKAWADAVTAFESAIQLMPGDEDANKALSEARAGLALVQNDKSRLADYQARIDAAKAAMTAERFADAVREYLAALRLSPDDIVATKGLKDAEAKLGDVKDIEKRKVDYDRAMVRAKTAYKDKRFDDAIDSLQTALKLIPGDPEAVASLATARQARNDARDDFLKLVDKGTLAMKTGRYPDAVRYFTDATKLFPDDNAAKNGLRDAQKALDTGGATPTTYAQFMAQAAAAIELLNYAEAARFYNQALLLSPNDVIALRELERLQKHLDRDVVKKLEFDRHMQIGKFAYDKKRYAEASKAFTKAVELFPADLVAVKALHDANYALAMADGYAAYNAKRYKDAVQLYEAALLEMPGDPAASNQLTQAKLMAKAMDGLRPGNPTPPARGGPPGTGPKQ